MSSIDTTTATAVREVLISTMRRIKPRFVPRSATVDATWKHRGDLARGRTTGRDLREFQVYLEPEIEATDDAVNAYSGGITLKSITRIEVGYPLSEQEAQRAIGADMHDITLMLYTLHVQLKGMMPVQVFGREQQLISASDKEKREGGYVTTFTILPGLHWFASDEVELLPEGT